MDERDGTDNMVLAGEGVISLTVQQYVTTWLLHDAIESSNGAQRNVAEALALWVTVTDLDLAVRHL